VRLWSIHPRYLDAKGLVALWREGLLAKKVLEGRTKGYRHHPQLVRFREQSSPVASIKKYLYSVWLESVSRGYAFNRRKLGTVRKVTQVPVSSGQLKFELRHLRTKLRVRDRERYRMMAGVTEPVPHPLFRKRKGGIEEWERR